MSDRTPARGQARQRAPRLQEWMPNRMFDPVNNPFAIQNLLEREKHQDDVAFLPEADGRPQVNYYGNPLLRDADRLPPKTFQGNRLLEEKIAHEHAFHAEYDEDDDSDDHDLSDPEPQQTTAHLANAAKTVAVTDGPEHPEMIVNVAESEASGADISENTNEGIAATADLQGAAQIAAGATEGEETACEPVAEAVAPTEELSDMEASQAELAGDAADDAAEAVEAAADPATDIPVNEAAAEANAEPGAAADNAEALASSAGEDPELSAEASAGSEPVALAGPAEAEMAGSDQADTDAPAASDRPDTDSRAEAAEPAELVAPAAPAQPDLSSEAVTRLVEAAREEAQEQARRDIEDARQQAYQQGLEAGIAQAKAELQQCYDDQAAQLKDLITSLQSLSHDPDALFEPFKTLAVHLAEQLVRGELAQSPQTISRLVDNCLRELAASGEKAVIIHLNPEDLEQYRPLVAQFGDSIVLRPDSLLTRGSVRASLDGSIVEDLIERRVKGIKNSLAQPVAGSWRPAIANPLAQRSQPEPPRKVAQPEVVSEVSPTDPSTPDDAQLSAEASMDIAADGSPDPVDEVHSMADDTASEAADEIKESPLS